MYKNTFLRQKLEFRTKKATKRRNTKKREFFVFFQGPKEQEDKEYLLKDQLTHERGFFYEGPNGY